MYLRITKAVQPNDSCSMGSQCGNNQWRPARHIQDVLVLRSVNVRWQWQVVDQMFGYKTWKVQQSQGAKASLWGKWGTT